MYRKINTKNTNKSDFSSLPPMLKSEHTFKVKGGAVISVHLDWLNQDQVLKGYNFVETCLTYKTKTGITKLLLTWDKVSGKLADYSRYECHKDGILDSVMEMISMFRKIRETEYQKSLNRSTEAAHVLTTSNRRPVKHEVSDYVTSDYTPDEKETVSKPSPSKKREEDDEPYVVQIPTYRRKDGVWVKAHTRRRPKKI